MAVRVGRLFIDLIAKTASFDSSLAKSRGKVKDFGETVGADLKKVGIAFGVLGAAAAAGLTALVVSSIRAADRMLELSQASGVNIETLSGLSHAANLSGIDTETLSSNLGRLAKRMQDAAQGGKEQIAAFKAVGITQQELQSGSITMEEALGRIAQRLAEMPEGWKQVAFAQEFFGKTGAAMIPLLDEIGRTGLPAILEAARRLGLVISKETAVAADQFTDNMSRLKGVVAGTGLILIKELTPALVGVSNALVGAAQQANAAQVAGAGLAAFTLRAAEAAIFSAAAVTVAWIKIGDAIKSGTPLFLVPLLGILKDNEDVANRTAAVWASATERIIALWERLPAVVDTGTSKTNQAVDSMAGKIKAFTTALGLADLRMDEFRATAEVFNEEKLDFVDTSGRSWDISLNAIAASWGSVTEKVNEFTLAMAAADLRLDSYRAQTEEAQKGMEEFKQAGDILSSGLADLFQGAITGGKDFQEVLKNLLTSLADMIIKATILRLLGVFLGGTGVGNFLGIPAPGAARQAGGAVIPGMAFPVGEAGPELFMPSTPGFIIPHDFLQGIEGGGKNITIINAQGADAGVEHRIRRAMAAERAAAVKEAQLRIQDRAMRTP